MNITSPVETTPAAAPAAQEFSSAAHGLRGAAALMVFFGHITGGLMLHIYPADPGFVNFVSPFVNLGTFGVEIFFVISGYVISGSVIRYSLADFFKRRFIRLYPVFLFFTLLYFAGNMILNIEPSKNNLTTLFKSLFFIDLFFPNKGLSPNAWTISYEIWFYVFAATLFAAWRAGSRTALAAIAAGFAVFVCVFPIALYFCAGCLIYYLRSQGKLNLGGWTVPAELAALAVIVPLAALRSIDYKLSDLLYPSVIALMIGTPLFFAAVTSQGSLVARLLSTAPAQFMGTISYSFYLAHPYTYFALRAAEIKLGLFELPKIAALPIFYTSMLALAVFGSWLVHILLERWPYRWAFGRSVYR